ncbi:hypothetical protein O6H91_05G037500 [Diphasiastrum complanatum]|uniref:Uncharacterized protein n=2 Tax=Diphasiastrum complanatum TaxID=34168 RepID=A0ACC2DN64_DIPCM|nr:hypothetical protein O6H91_05G037500 [Diphasiastrum complanatum]
MLAEEGNREKNDIWAELLEPIIDIPTKYGPRIKSHILKALAAGPPPWAQKLLKQSISNEVYRRNGSGATKRAVLLVLSKFHGIELKRPRTNQKRKHSGIKNVSNEGKSWEDPVSVPALLSERCRHVLQKLRSMDKFQKLLDLIRSICPGSQNNSGMVSSVTPPSKTSAIDIQLIDARLTSGLYGSTPQLFAEDLQKVWTNIIEVATEMIFLAKSLGEIVETEYNTEISSVIGKKHEAAKRSPNLNAVQIDDDSQLPVKFHPFSDHQCQVPGKDKSQAKASDYNPKTQFTKTCTDFGKDILGESARNDRDSRCRMNYAPSCHSGSVEWIESTCDKEIAEWEHKKSDASTAMPNVPTNLGEGASCKVCEVAGSEEFVVSCDSCKATYHIYCLSPFLTNVPDSPWLCESCLCRICRIDVDDSSVLLCDSCDHGYHMYCLQPPLESIPEGHWFCPVCIDNKETIRNVCKNMEVENLTLGSEHKFKEHLYLQGICYVCGIDEDRSHIILCYDCGEVYHRYCLTTPILSPVNSDWLCPECEAIEKDDLPSDEEC